jgi:hypothetical protein
MSLLEIAITLFIFSFSIAIISGQANHDVGGINTMQHHIADVYHHGL